uniref:C2 domain containing 3 centriole elongation regulator n=1 Tax=Dicentrarchus labrax TaxID=13489 RepID=A0A8C4IFJ3_DICLA
MVSIFSVCIVCVKLSCIQKQLFSVPSDVSPSTGLPPLVEGQLRCFLRVTISRVLWTVHKPPSATFVRLRWWGESSNGTHFFPRDGSQTSQKAIKTTARFAIRCGPKQFTSYLTDMGSMVLEILTKPDHLPIARAQVAGISRLSLSHPISGFYTLVSPTSEKLGELQVSLNLEALTEAYDSSSSGPITDISIEGPHVNQLPVPSQPRPLSVGSGIESAGSSSGNTPRFEVVACPNQMAVSCCSKSLNLSIIVCIYCCNIFRGKDHLYFQNAQKDKVILERGNKLRNAMVVSALKCDMDSAPTLKDTPLPLPKDNILPPSKLVLQKFVKILNTSPLPLWDGEDSFHESLSGHSSVCGDSELNDPQYDQSLLENLFYKTPVSRQEKRMKWTNKLIINQLHMLYGIHTRYQDSTDKTCTFCTLNYSPYFVSSPNSAPQRSANAGDILPGLSAEQLTLLSLIRLARVTVDSLTVPTGSTTTTPRKTLSKGKPPRPLTSKKCTYFIEYVFPMASTSSRHERRKGGDGEVTRAVASKVTGGAVKFHHHSMFPVHLTTATVKQWWGTDLIFKIYSRKSDQKKPVPIGEAVHPLRFLLQSKQLSQSVVLPVRSVEGNRETQEIGPLKVSLDLAADSKDFSSEKSKSKEELPAGSFEDSRLNVWSPQRPSKKSSPHPSLHTSPHISRLQVEEEPEVLLHTLLMVPDGKNFSCGPMQAPNVYLNCKLFWCDETARSVISWGQANPSFNFVQVTPVALTTKLLERMKNNMMVIEVWQKKGSSGQDRLLGLVKLPLHQFYMSFRDPNITHLLLQAQYPVLGVDCYMPVIDVFSGSCKGNLRVVLAMGRSEQIVALQRTRDEEYDSLSHLVRPVHLLDHQPQETMREHLFVIRVEKVNGLTPLQSTVWGEADCYVQYSFPCQEGDPAVKVDQNLIESSVNLKVFRTTTTLCVPDPMFGHTETHVLLAPDGVPVQRLLLSSLSSQGLRGGGGVQFEVWCRYYYPNVRDQLVAKGMLPLSKLCAMVTMQRQHPDEAQMFSLPLIPRTDSPIGHQPQPSGLLDVCIRYKHRPVRPEGQNSKGVASRVVTLVVQVHRASGLQAAARVVSEQDERFSYFAGVGVNAYVTVQLSFLPESERRSTRVAARTFCPEFDHHMEVSCDLLVQRSSGETCSLAEQLDELLICSVPLVAAVLTHKPKDVMLGTVKIPLADLIHKRTGISGWFGVYIPEETNSSQHQHILVGGLEISVNFSHHSDRERVIKAAQGVGWEIAQNEVQDDEEAWGDSMRKISLIFSMPRAWIPVHCLLLPGHTELQRSTYCYFRYKFYDQDAFCSQMKHPSVEVDGEEGQAKVTFQGSRTLELRSTQPLMWYLREERLEVQVWVAFKKDKTRRPRDTDRLVGSAFVDLSSLAKTPKQKLTLSGVYPLFRRSAADLQGAALRVHITLTTGFVPVEHSAGVDTLQDSDSQGELLSEEVEAADRAPSPITPKNSHRRHNNKSSRTPPDITSVQHTELSVDESFPVTVAVDRAMHLNLKGCPLAERSEVSPCCCVSYITANSPEPASTAVIANTDCPVWDHQHECRLSKQLLVDPQQSLVFKVWHKGEMERVIGFASVDLSPLLCGFQSVCGWYNITDFSGQCHGQLKVSITPLKGVQDLRGQRKTVNEEATKNSSVRESIHACCSLKGSQVNHCIYSSPLQMFRSSESDRHFEHMDKVRLYHQSLQEQTAANSVCSSAVLTPLLCFYRKKLSELDNIQRYFSRKLSTPTFPSMSEQDCHTRREEPRDTETDACQLLFKSNQLVGEVNSIISGELLVHAKEDSEIENEEGTDGDEDGTGCRRDKEADYDEEEEEEEDYDEVVVKPRPLNEVTSLTDKTSPWTSILSDPDLVSLESLEAPDEPDLSQNEDEKRKMLNLQTHDCGGEHGREEPDSFCSSAGDTSDREDERTLQTLDERQAEGANSPDEGSGDCSSHTTQHATDTHDASCSLDNPDTPLQTSVPAEVPNFFLPSHQLEASMRAIRLAPSFSKSTSDPVSICHRICFWHTHSLALCPPVLFTHSLTVYPNILLLY